MKTNETDQLTEMWLKCEAQRQMHRLAHKHFEHLEFWLHSFPLILITAVSGIIAFLSSSALVKDSGKEFLSLTVGALSVVSVAWQQIGKICNYGTRAEMHKNASLGMKKITDKITFNFIDPDIGPGPPKNSSGDSEDKKSSDANNIGVQGAKKPKISPDTDKSLARSYRELYEQCLEACNSAIPIEINQAFLLLDSRLKMALNRSHFIEKMAEFKKFPPKELRQVAFSIAYNELFCAISSFRSFPYALIDPDIAVTQTMRKVKKSIDTSEDVDEETNCCDIFTFAPNKSKYQRIPEAESLLQNSNSPARYDEKQVQFLIDQIKDATDVFSQTTDAYRRQNFQEDRDDDGLSFCEEEEGKKEDGLKGEVLGSEIV